MQVLRIVCYCVPRTRHNTREALTSLGGFNPVNPEKPPITDRPRELVIRSEQDDAQQVRVTVRDCGVGFSADSKGQLFNSFFTTKSSGMGMGLSICRTIIELHGGRIWAVPNAPHGATVQFTLPLHPPVVSH
ncbi:MAG: ATP-binding protein [Steroidobacteraceae bacterium]